MNDRVAAILSELRTQLQFLYGAELEQIILFGSHARGDAVPTSDIDIVVVLSKQRKFDSKSDHADEIIHRLSLKHDIVISSVFTTSEKVERSGLPFYRNVRREGIAV